MIATKNIDVGVAVRTAIGQLMTYDVVAGGHYITTPLMYASGGAVVVRVEQAGDSFFVSDFGAGLNEAMLIGGDLTYKRVAREVAQGAGVEFDNFSFFVVRASRSQLAGAVSAVANASQEAVNTTALRVSEDKHRDENAILYDRLAGVFGQKRVVRDAAIIGASNTEWHIGSLVSVDSRRVAFEAVSKHPSSIVFATTKFDDISRAHDAPSRVAVVASKKALGTYLAVLSHNADVIERQVENRVYERLLAA